MNKALLCLVAAMPMATQAASLCLCRAYSGGRFWASTHCNQHRALIERIVSVPDGMPFEQQIDLGQQKLQPLGSLNASHNTVIINNGSQGAGKAMECRALDERVKHLDAAARAPQSLPSLDRIRDARKRARDRQFEIRC